MFRFKLFSVEDDRSTMKVGTDAVVLGAWVNIGNAKTILDIGTGCGVIALMMAQRAQGAQVDAIEIDPESARQAAENFAASPWRLNLMNRRIQDHEGLYDLIVSNPPFFSNSLLPPGNSRTIARHTITLTHEELVKSVIKLLAPKGRFAVIVPSREMIGIADKVGLQCTRITAVFPKNRLERWLLEFSVDGTPASVEEKLVLTEDGSKRTKEYGDLTKDFYL